MAAIPKREIFCEKILLDSLITEKTIHKAKEALEKDFKPISDMRASSSYRMEIAKNLEQVALSDEYFIQRKLYPNVDFYSGIIYKAMGIPTNMFTVMFALGRLPGWLAHWREMILDPKSKINRPRQIYTGPTLRDVTPVGER